MRLSKCCLLNRQLMSGLLSHIEFHFVENEHTQSVTQYELRFHIQNCVDGGKNPHPHCPSSISFLRGYGVRCKYIDAKT